MPDNSAQQDDFNNVSVVTLVPNDKKLLPEEKKLPSPSSTSATQFPQTLQQDNKDLNTQVSSFTMSSEPLRFETNAGKGNKQPTSTQPDPLPKSSSGEMPVSLNVEPEKVVVESTWGKVFQWSTFAFIIGGAIVAGVYYALVVLQL